MRYVVLENKLYQKDLLRAIHQLPKWQSFQNTSVMISGATGMIGSCIVDILMLLNKTKKLNCTVITLGRNKEKAWARFEEYWNSKNFVFVQCDINRNVEYEGTIDFLIHAASNTHPRAYATDPIGTITANIIGTQNLLKLASKKNVINSAFLSSVEIYGENRGDIEEFDESYLGYIDCNTLRAGYPESKRAGEALCQAFIRQKGLKVVIPRLARSFGPTMLLSDTKALSQFLLNGVNGKNIILKSDGSQQYSYVYSVDAAVAILFCLINGKNGTAYNVAGFNTTLRSLAEEIADISGTKVTYELPDLVESVGFSKATKAILNTKRILKLGFIPHYGQREALEQTLNILKS